MSGRVDAGSQLAVFLLRLWIGLNFVLVHGLEKVQEPELFLESADMRLFPSYRTLGWCAIAAEFVGGLMLTIGFKTRLAAAALLATMVSAAWVVHGGGEYARQELPLTYGAIALFFVLHGAGTPSVDAWIERRRRKASPW